jgi:hypothetical protein
MKHFLQQKKQQLTFAFIILIYIITQIART